MSRPPEASGADVPALGADDLPALAQLPADEACLRLASSAAGLPAVEAERRLLACGRNVVAREERRTVLGELWDHAWNPLNGLLMGLAVVSWLLGDLRSWIVVTVMVVLATFMSFLQEHRSSEAAARLRSMVKTLASVRRPGLPDEGYTDVDIAALVPGDVVKLSAGDLIPADLRLLEAKDLFINQSALTGESMPVEKSADAHAGAEGSPFDLPNMAFMGASVVSGYATALVVRTGPRTFFGELAAQIAGASQPTAFDIGIARVTWLMIRCIAVMGPLVFIINGLTKHDWLEALMFAVAVAVGLMPEMLSMIVTVNLAKGALAMAGAKVIVKRLDAIQNLGAMDVLCTDKTGTLTQDRIILKRHLDLNGVESERVLEFAWLNSHFQSGLRNLLDHAVLEHAELHHLASAGDGYRKVDEMPFDFSRRRLSVVLARAEAPHVLVCKGAVEEVFAACTSYALDGDVHPLDAEARGRAATQVHALNADGFRVVAVAYRSFDGSAAAYSIEDEQALVLLGFVAFLDPPRDTAREALSLLAGRGITVKILTGDNEVVTRKICHEVGLAVDAVLLGSELDALDDAELGRRVDGVTVFAKLTPAHKARVVGLLRARDHVVGFMGDGINDSPALKAADVGLSVDTAVDIAREAADIILLEKSLLVLHEGVLEGRRVFANISKYIRMGASSNFGNMFSMLGASIFLPFLPMLPIQVITNNLLYDFSQAAIPTDRVDDEELVAPRRWDIGNLFKFMLVLGPVSSLFDYLTFGMMLWVFDAWHQPALFQTGWFVESLLTQSLIIHILRTQKIPFLQSRASTPLLAASGLICLVGIALPSTALGRVLGFQPLPLAYWPLLALILLAYATLTHLAKMQFVRRWGL